ncbi:MAG: cache domain-containing protein, partial [Oscillospiraceae bacterium]
MNKKGAQTMIERAKKRKTLRMTITVPIIIFICSASIILAVFTVYMGYRSTISSLTDSMTAAAGIAQEDVSNKISRFEGLIEEVASNSILYSSETTDDEKAAFVSTKTKQYSLLNGFILTTAGKNITTGENCSANEYFTAAKEGKTYISSPYVDEKSGELVMAISAPIWSGGNKGSSVTGVVCFTMPQALINSVIENIHVSSTGTAYIIDKAGNSLANVDTQRVIDKINIGELVKTDASLQDMANLHAKALAGETGFGQYTYEGVRKFLAYAPVTGSDGWAVCINAPVSDFTKGVTTTIYGAAILLVIIILVGVFGCIYIANRVVDPLKTYIDRLSKLADGDVNTPLKDIEAASSEFAVLKSSIMGTLHHTGAIINDIDYLLTEFSGGNFDVFSRETESYVGDYKHILTSFRTLKR